MAYTISDDCIMCGACADNCPCDAISEGDGKYEINADACVDCGSCAEVCPVGTKIAGKINKILIVKCLLKVSIINFCWARSILPPL